jgi:hypothetical protein
MAKLPWIHVRNPFESCTRNNNRKMDAISQDMDLKLKADIANPKILAIYNAEHPKTLAFHTTYVAYKTTIADLRGSTQTIENFWKKASSELFDQWDTKVKNVYVRNSDEYKSLLPNGHEPFRKGGYQEQFANIESFRKRLYDDGNLADALALVDDFIATYSAAWANHVALKKLIKDTAADLKLKRADCALAMFCVLGGLLALYPDKPDIVANYFDTTEIQRATPKDEGGESTECTIEVPGETSVEGGFPFDDTTKIRAYNSGTEILYLYTTSTKDGAVIPEECTQMLPEDEKIFTMYTLGVAGNRYFYIGNKGTEAGQITIDIVPNTGK